MSLPSSFYGWLSNKFPESSIYLSEAPINSPMPSIVFNLIDSTPIIKNGGGDGECNSSFQVDIYHSDFLVAHEIAKQIEKSLTAYQGVMGDQYITRSDASFLIRKSQDPDNIFRSLVSLNIRHKDQVNGRY